jgi:3-keto-disaccharide hydrolase
MGRGNPYNSGARQKLRACHPKIGKGGAWLGGAFLPREKLLTRREALISIGKVVAGVTVIAAATAAGLGGYFLYEGQSASSRRTQSEASSNASLQSLSTTVEPGFTSLFDGATLDGWQEAGPGGFDVVDGTLQSFGGMGLLWYTRKQFGNFTLRADWKVLHLSDNSGVFVRFPDPGNDPWVAVNDGYEVQIDDVGAPDGNPLYKTGGVYGFAAPTEVASNPVGEWNLYEIHAVGQSYRVILNGIEVTDFVGSRSTMGYVGLQNHSGTVTFRNVRIMEL